MSTCLLVIIAVYTIIVTNIAIQIIDTTTARQYQNGEIHCNGNEDCRIICDEEQSCQNTDIYCPSNGNYLCEVQCLGASNNCHQSFIDCSSSIDCIVTCNGPNACDSSTIKWPSNNNGSLTCNGADSCSYINFPIPPPNTNYIVDTCDEIDECKYATFTCPLNADCNIKCGALRSCHDAYIIWSLNNSSINSILTTPTEPCTYCTRPPIYPIDDYTNLYLTCNEQTCYDGVVYCPKYAECHITCDGAFACYGTSFIWPETHLYTLNCADTSSCQGLIYAPYNNNEPLSVDNVQGHQQKIHCPSNAECNIECNGFYSCKASVFNCPSNSQCNITCIGMYSCQGAIFNGIGTVSLCSGGLSCQDMHFPEPPPNIDYQLLCVDSTNCAGSTIRCPQNADCDIACIGQESCKDVNIVWSTNPAVTSTLSCGSATDACLNVNIAPINYQSAVDDWTDYYLVCSGNAQCANSIIDCPSSAICHITCSGTNSCKNTIINGGNNELTIICSGVSSCYSSEIYAQTASALNISNCTAIDSCKLTMIWFPAYDGFNDNVRAVIDGITDIGLTEVIFYAFNGWKDILITNYMYDEYGIINHIGDMFCGNDYDMFCNFDMNGWQCHPYGDIRCDITPTPSFTNPADNPTTAPTNKPTVPPTDNPTKLPSSAPTNKPTVTPTGNPTKLPSSNPTNSPITTNNPTSTPTDNPTPSPTLNPTPSPTSNPTPSPTVIPTGSPITTNNPTPSPTDNPTPSPTTNPSPSPTNNPTPSPTNDPTAKPSQPPITPGTPTNAPTDSTDLPTPSPTNNPTPSPTNNPTPSPTNDPTPSPTNNPTPSPTNDPTPSPTNDPTPSPTNDPTPSPTNVPNTSVSTITDPTPSPTDNPTPSPTANPTASPTNDPTTSATDNPNPSPTNNPSVTIQSTKSTMNTRKDQDGEGEIGEDISTTIINKSERDETGTENAFNNTDSIKKIIIIILGAIVMIIFCIIVRWRCKKLKEQRTAKVIQAAIQHTTNANTNIFALRSVASNSVVSNGINDKEDGQSTPYTAMKTQNGATWGTYTTNNNDTIELEMEGGLSNKHNRGLLTDSTHSTDNTDDINGMNTAVEGGNTMTGSYKTGNNYDIPINPMQANDDNANSDEEQDNYMGNRKVTKGNDYAEPMPFNENRKITAGSNYNGGQAVPHHMNANNRKVTAGNNDYNGMDAMPQEIHGSNTMGHSHKKIVIASFGNNNDANSDEEDANSNAESDNGLNNIAVPMEVTKGNDISLIPPPPPPLPSQTKGNDNNNNKLALLPSSNTMGMY